MDLDKILHFVPAHIEQIIIVLTVLFVVTTILLLVRSLKEKSDDNSSQIDVGTIEGALKRVLLQNPQTVVERTVVGDEGTALADLAPLKAALADKERQLASLNDELAEAKAAASTAAATSGSGAPPASAEAPQNAGAVAALEMEISDLKARLAEYEIIEDDIADLALYKEENARLKREIEQARSAGVSSASVHAETQMEANPALGIPGLTEALEAEAAVQAAAPKAEAPASAPVDSLGEFDAEKMMAEADLLSSAPQGEEPEINALSDLLDTDKLLEEVNSLDAQDVMSEFKDKSKIG